MAAIVIVMECEGTREDEYDELPPMPGGGGGGGGTEEGVPPSAADAEEEEEEVPSTAGNAMTESWLGLSTKNSSRWVKLRLNMDTGQEGVVGRGGRGERDGGGGDGRVSEPVSGNG